MYEDFYPGGDYFDPYNYDYDYPNRQKQLDDFVMDSFNGCVNSVVKKARQAFRGFNEDGTMSEKDKLIAKQIKYFAVIFTIKVALYLAIKQSVEDNCEPLL